MAPGPDWRSHDLPALQVAVAALNATEGYLWTSIRGAGLAYGASIAVSLETKALTFVVFKSPDAFAAFAAAKSLVDSLLSGKVCSRQASEKKTCTLTVSLASCRSRSPKLP